MSTCQIEEINKGGAYPRSCLTCKFGPCHKGLAHPFKSKPLPRGNFHTNMIKVEAMRFDGDVHSGSDIEKWAGGAIKFVRVPIIGWVGEIDGSPCVCAGDWVARIDGSFVRFQPKIFAALFCEND